MASSNASMAIGSAFDVIVKNYLAEKLFGIKEKFRMDNLNVNDGIFTNEMAIKEGWYTKAGSKWTTMERQMLMYRSASFWVRAYAPEISMGMYTVEEAQDMGEKTIDVEAEIVDTKVEREIQENANKETFSMKVEEPEPTLNETATKVAEQPKETPAGELFQNAENKVKREF